jgi:hypothetical protein
LFIACVAASWAGSVACAEEAAAVDVGNRLELLVDGALIERMEGAALKLHPPQPREVVMPFDAPWEGARSTYVSIFQDGDKYRMYYRGQGDAKSPRVACYAESRDGIHWERPALGLHEFNGSKENNIILLGATADNFAAFLDTRPGVPAEERYKGVGGGLGGFVSGDGVRWQRVAGVKPGAKPLPANVFDSQNVAFWDSAKEQYACYFRGRRARGDVRTIARTTSRDFREWSDWEFLDLGDSPPEHLYTSAAIPYFRAPQFVLAFPNRFMESRGMSDGVFMTSRDGLRFERRFLEAFLRPGPDPENWTDRNMRIAWGIVALAPEEISIYWDEHYKHDTCRLRRGVLRTDGFVSVNAPHAGGEFTTKPLRFSGRELLLNYATSAVGSLRVELQDVDGSPLPGYSLDDCPEIVGDRIEAIVRWKQGSDLTALSGKPVRMRIVLRDADVYSFRFR